MKDFRPLMGLCPIGKLVFSNEDAVKYKQLLQRKLKEWNVFTRRYFYPLICDYACYRNVSIKDPLTVARRVSGAILTLPIYESLHLSDVERICEIIKSLHLKKGRITLAGPPGEIDLAESTA